MKYFLRSARLGFRPWREDDLPLANSLWSDARVTGLFGGPFTPAQVRERLTKEIAQQRDHGIQLWPVFLLEDGRHAGCGGLRPYRPEDHILELGYHLHAEFWGRGLASEASTAVIHYAFNSLGAEALFAGHHPANETSRRVLLKLGFVYTGDAVYPTTGILEPTYLLRKPVAASR